MVDRGVPLGLLIVALILMAVVLVLGVAALVEVDLYQWGVGLAELWSEADGEEENNGRSGVENEEAETVFSEEEIASLPGSREPRALAARDHIAWPPGLKANPHIILTLPVVSVFEE
jgi:hypothetical protein